MIRRQGAPALGQEKGSATTAVSPQAPALTPAERLQLWNTGITAFAAVVSFVAAVIAARALAAQLAAPGRERRNQAYHSLMLGPALDVLPEFEAHSGKLLNAGIARFRELVSMKASLQEIHAHSASLVRTFNDLFLPMQYRLLGAAHAWRDQALLANLNVALETLQDDVTQTIDQLPVGKAFDPPLLERMRTAVAEVTAVIVHHEVDPPRVGGLRRGARWVRAKLPKWLGGTTR